MNALTIHNIDTFYGMSHILHGLSLEVPKGDIVCLLGRNGAGKTTTIRSIMGMTLPSRGSIKYFGEEICGLRPSQIYTKKIRIVPQGRYIFPMLTVEENLRLALIDISLNEFNKEKEIIFAMFPVLSEKKRQKGRTLSGGELQMVAIARAIMGNPRLILMDEPSEGLAPLIISRIEKTILDLKQKNITIFLAEQNLQSALRIGDFHYIIDGGVNDFSGNPTDLQLNGEIQIKYLGVGIFNA